MEQISDLFHGHPDLIQGFNSFLPSGYSIDYSIDHSDPTGSKYITFVLPPEVATATSDTTPATISTPTSTKTPGPNVSQSEKTRKRTRWRYVIYASDLITQTTGKQSFWKTWGVKVCELSKNETKDVCNSCRRRGLQCGPKTLPSDASNFLREPEELSSATLTQQTIGGEIIHDDIEDRTDAITALLQLRSKDSKSMQMLERENLIRRQQLLLIEFGELEELEELDTTSRMNAHSKDIESSRVISSHSNEIKVKFDKPGTSSEYEDNEDDEKVEKPSRKKVWITRDENKITSIAYWKRLIKNNPVETQKWDGLIMAYKLEFVEMTTGETSVSREEKWLRLNGYEDASRIELTYHDTSWFDAVKALIRLSSSEVNKVHLTWEIVELSRVNTFHSLHTLQYDDAAFLRILGDAFRKYPNSREFQIAFAFASIASGQYYNGIEQLDAICQDDGTPKSYAGVLLRSVRMWLNISHSLVLNHPHDCHQRAITFNCVIPEQWLEVGNSVDQFADDCLALLSLQSNNQLSFNYGYFQDLPGHSTYAYSEPRIRLDNVGRLVSDYWGSLGTRVLSVFRNLLQKITRREEYAVDEVLKRPEGNTRIYLAASVTEISLAGYTSLAEWNCVVSCLRWLIALVGTPNTDVTIRACTLGCWKMTPIWDHLHNSIPEDFHKTLFKKQYVITEQNVSETYISTIPCWVDMFSGAYIGAHTCQHFTYSNMFEETGTWTGKGLKVEFAVLIHAAGVEEIVEVEGTPILCSFRSALIPITRFEDDSVQWHLILAKDDDGPFRWIHHRDDFLLSLPTVRLRNIKIEDLKGTAYVGWQKTGVNVILGTVDPPLEIPRSKLPICQHIHIPSGFNIQVGIQSSTSPVGALLGVTKVYRQCSLAFSIAPPDNYCAIVDQLYSKHVIVYDEHTKAAVFCKLINLVLLLVRAYLRNNGYPNNVLDLNLPRGLQQSQAEIRNLGSKSIVAGFTFHDVIKVMMHRYSALFQFLRPEMRLTRSSILGFELTDILENNDTVHARKLAISKGVGTWSMLASTTDIVFCGGIGQSISVVNNVVTAPNCAARLPTGHDILIFPIPLVKRHFDGGDGNCLKQRGRGEFQWEPTSSLFDCKLGSECDGVNCWKSRLQCIKKGSGVLKRRKNCMIVPKFDWMNGDGAVCFGYIPGR